jgi:hypothetical protein
MDAQDNLGQRATTIWGQDKGLIKTKQRQDKDRQEKRQTRQKGKIKKDNTTQDKTTQQRHW